VDRSESRPHRATAFVLSGVILATLATPVMAQPSAPLTIVAAVAVKGALDQLGPMFETSSGHKVTIEYDAPADIAGRISSGGVDVVLGSAAGVDAMVKSGAVIADSEAPVGIAVASLAFKRGTPRPDIATPEALKAFVLGAKSISFSDPAGGGGSSVYFAGVIQRLGVADAVMEKATLTKIGEGALPAASGQTEFAVAQSSEIALQPGLDGVPILPADPKSKSTFDAAVPAKSAQPDVARAFIRFMLSPAGTAVRKAKGLDAG
jgi:molybdate transport system substrate-binding protein